MLASVRINARLQPTTLWVYISWQIEIISNRLNTYPFKTRRAANRRTANVRNGRPGHLTSISIVL